MTLRIKYILFISIIHLVLIALVFQLFKDHLILFFTSEFLLALSIYFSYRLYRGLIQPIDFIAASTTAIKEEDFSVKFRPTGSAELNRLISVYNEMIDKIREERTRLQENHYFLDRIIDVSPTAIIILDFDQRIANRARNLINIMSADR